MSWTVYLVRCKDATIYTGITVDLSARLSAHDQGRGAKYTRGRGPVTLVWSESGLSESEARKREAQIKQLTRKQKDSLINAEI